MSKTGNDLVTDLRAKVLEPSPTFFSDARLLSLANLAQDEYVRRTRVLQSFAFTSTIQGQSDYPLPADWLGSEKVFFNATNDGITPNWRPLEATNLEKLGQENPNFLSTATNVQAFPTKYYIIGHTLYLFPRPKANGTNDLFLFYESTATPLATLNDSFSIDDSLYPGIRAYALAEMWYQDQEDAKGDREMAKFEKEVGLGFKWKNKRILDGKWKLDIQSFIPFNYSSVGAGSIGGQVNPLNQ